MRNVQASASSHPPPSATPFTHAITGLPQRSIWSKTCCPRCEAARPDAESVSASARMSAPAANARSPEPVSRITSTLASAASSAKARSSSSNITASSAWSTSGRSSVTVAIARSRSTRSLVHCTFLISSCVGISRVLQTSQQADDTIETMIKGITSIAHVASEDVYAKLGGLFRSLGFEEGKGWVVDDGQGAPFLAPIGNLELVLGRAPATPNILIETTQLDGVYAVVRTWMAANFRTEEVVVRLTAPAATHWNSRLFTADLAPGLK